MNIIKPILIASALALAAGPAFAEKSKDDPGFNKLDRNNDGWLSRTEAAKNPYLRKNFKAADKDSDGKLSRTEYLQIMTKKDVSALKNKVSGDKDRNAATGSSRPAK
jgi:Ca2+-binding EF-hand superfamily protein